jgi:hypothetical protein
MATRTPTITRLTTACTPRQATPYDRRPRARFARV